jgi:hypothetical protein
MTTKEAITPFKYYLQSNHKRRTIESYTLLLDRFNATHAERLLVDIKPDEILGRTLPNSQPPKCRCSIGILLNSTFLKSISYQILLISMQMGIVFRDSTPANRRTVE